MNNQSRRYFLKCLGKTSLFAIASPAFTCMHNSNSCPNILLFLPDQHRFDWLGISSEIPVRTPHLRELAKRGMQFTHAVSPSPVCAPARACLASGKEYDRCGVHNNNFNYPLFQTTFYTLLRNAGYYVMGCGKFDLHKATKNWGLDGKHLLREWGFSDGIDNAGKLDAVNSGSEIPKDPYMAYLHEKGLARIHVDDLLGRDHKSTYPTSLSDESYCDNWIGDKGLSLLDNVPVGKPWFLQINFTGPHSPWDITRTMSQWYRDVRFASPVYNTQYPAEIHQNVRRNYAAMVDNIDQWIGRFIEKLEKRGEIYNTLIVYSSDHGEMLGDHNLWGKTVPYHPSTGIPLIINGPGVQRGLVNELPVSLIDLPATFLEYAHLPLRDDMDSISLKPLLEGKVDFHRSYVLSGLDEWRMVFDGRYKLIKGFNGNKIKAQGTKIPYTPNAADPLLFDLQNDPFEMMNLATVQPQIVRKLEKFLLVTK